MNIKITQERGYTYPAFVHYLRLFLNSTILLSLSLFSLLLKPFSILAITNIASSTPATSLMTVANSGNANTSITATNIIPIIALAMERVLGLGKNPFNKVSNVRFILCSPFLLLGISTHILYKLYHKICQKSNKRGVNLDKHYILYYNVNHS